MQTQNFGKLNIIIAVYGLQSVTEKVRNLISDTNPQTLHFIVNNKVIGEDGWRGQLKSITILYNYDDGDLQIATAKEGDAITITPDTIRKSRFVQEESYKQDGLSVLAATYGLDDVTYKVKRLISSYNTLSFKVDNIIFGDAWYGVAKTLIIILGEGHDVKAVEVFVERELCYIDLNDVIEAV